MPLEERLLVVIGCFCLGALFSYGILWWRHRWSEGEETFDVKAEETPGKLREGMTQVEVAALVRQTLIDQGYMSLSQNPAWTVGMSLTSLEDPSLELMSSLDVTIDVFARDDYVAIWGVAGCYGAGATQEEAVSELQKSIASFYREVKDTPNKKLGRLPQHDKKKLLALIRDLV